MNIILRTREKIQSLNKRDENAIVKKEEEAKPTEKQIETMKITRLMSKEYAEGLDRLLPDLVDRRGLTTHYPGPNPSLVPAYQS